MGNAYPQHRFQLQRGGANDGDRSGRLVQVRVYLTDIDDWPAFNTLYANWAGDARPARAVVPVPMLHHGFRLEIEAVAVA